jgi:hypothetical protein
MVGPDAAEAACRLVQHAEGQQTFREHCLDLMRSAAAAGDLPARQVAYLTDASRVHAGESQIYGTKFRIVDGELELYPLATAVHVDARRAAVGLGPLTDHAQRLRKEFGL